MSAGDPRSGRQIGTMMGACIGSLSILSGCAPVLRATESVLEHRLELEGLEHRILEVEGARLETWVDDPGDSGDPLVLLHGFGPSAPWQWTKQVDALAEGHRLVVPNLLWFGKSTDPAREYGLIRQAEVVAGLVEQLEIERADVVAVSYGGMVAYQLASLRPDLVQRLVLVDTPGAMFRRDAYLALLDRHGARSATELFLPTDASGVERLFELAFWDPPSVPRALRSAASEVLYDPHRAEKAELLERALSELAQGFDGPVPEMPSLVVWGRHDTVFPLWVGEELAKCLDAELVIIEKARHAPNVEHPEVFNRVVLDWLEGSATTHSDDASPDQTHRQEAPAEP